MSAVTRSAETSQNYDVISASDSITMSSKDWELAKKALDVAKEKLEKAKKAPFSESMLDRRSRRDSQASSNSSSWFSQDTSAWLWTIGTIGTVVSLLGSYILGQKQGRTDVLEKLPEGYKANIQKQLAEADEAARQKSIDECDISY